MGKFRTDVYSVLKVCTVVLVVLAHVTRMYTSSGAIHMGENTILTGITTFIYRFHMPLFIFLSGAIYQICITNGKYKSIKVFFWAKLKRLMIPYFTFGILYVAPVVVYTGVTTYSYPRYVLEGIILSHDSRHLWFLWTLFIIFIITRMLKPIFDRFRFALPYLTILAIAVSAIHDGRFPAWFSIVYVAQYYCYFLMGCLFESSPKLKNKLNQYWYIAIPCFVFLMFARKSGGIYGIFFAVLGIIMSYCIGAKLVRYISKFRLYAQLQDTGIGVYLFHPMIIYICFYHIKSVPVNPYVSCAAVFVFSIALSYILTKIIKKLHLSVLIGE